MAHLYSMIPASVFDEVLWEGIDHGTQLIYLKLWGLATQCDARGSFVHEVRGPMQVKSMAFALRFEAESFTHSVNILKEAKLLAEDENGLYIVAFRQANPTTQAERRRKWVESKRGKKANQPADDPNADFDPPIDDGFDPDDFSENSTVIPKDSNALNVKVKVKSKGKSKSTGEPKDSESSDSAQSARKPDEFFDKLAEITHAEPKLQGSLIGRTKAQLLKVNATLQELDRFNAYWYAADFRGLKGQSPSLTQIVSEWGKAKAWNPNSAPTRPQGQPRNEPAGFANLRAAAGMPI